MAGPALHFPQHPNQQPSDHRPWQRFNEPVEVCEIQEDGDARALVIHYSAGMLASVVLEL